MTKTALATGLEAEELACQFLQQQGLKILSRNFRSPRGELDVILEDGQTLVFVEIRYRKQTRFGSGAESVTHAKQTKLITTALYYLQQHPKYSNRPSRFDVVSITRQTGQTEIDWIKDAFQS